jgi:hypothetical protein
MKLQTVREFQAWLLGARLLAREPRAFWPSRLVAMAAEEGSKSETGENYEECIGAKKHLVMGVIFHAGERSNSLLAIGVHRGKIQRWKRLSGDGVAMSAGIISLVFGR